MVVAAVVVSTLVVEVLPASAVDLGLLSGAQPASKAVPTRPTVAAKTAARFAATPAGCFISDMDGCSF
ncbi:hypothetical protein D3C87_2003220 [compost metagenome]